MTLLRRRPREVYRVYSEQEYLNGAGSEPVSIAEWPAVESPLGEPGLGELPLGQFPSDELPLGSKLASDWAMEAQSPETGSVGVPIGGLYDGFAEPRSRPVRERRLRRVVGVAVLVGAIGTVGGLVVLNLTRAGGGGGGRRGSLVVATRSSRAVRSPAVDDAQPQVISSRPALMPPAPTARPRVSQPGRRSSRGQVPRRSGGLNADRLSRGRGDVAVAADYVPGRSSGAASAAMVTAAPTAPVSVPAPAPPSAPAQVSTTTASVAPPPAPTAPEKRSEFGFER